MKSQQTSLTLALELLRIWAQCMRQHSDVIGCPATLAVGLNGMCHLNAAIPCLEEQPSLGAPWEGGKSPKGWGHGMNPLGSTCPSSGDGKQKEAMATRKWILPNLPMFNPKEISLFSACGIGFCAGDCCGARMVFGCSCWFFPVHRSWKIECTSSVFRHGKPW